MSPSRISPMANDEAHALYHGYACSESTSASLRPKHTSPLWTSGTRRVFPSSCGRILSLPEFQFQDLSPLAFPAGSPEKESVVFEPPLRDFFLDGHWRSNPRPRPKTFKFLGVAGGTIERSCYSPHYVNTERDYERDYQATLPQGRTAADGCKPRHGREDRKRERS